MSRDRENQRALRLRSYSGRLSLLFCFVFLIFLAQAVGQRPGASRDPGSSAGTDAALTPPARQSLNAALESLQANALTDAERSARAAVAASPRSATTHNVLGVVLDRSGRADEAFNEFNTAVRLDPKFISARNNLGRMLAERGKISEAITQFENVLKADPSHVQAHYKLGALYADAGDFVKAAEHFAQARARAPEDPQLALAFINVAYRANRGSEADTAAELVERVAASDPRILFTLGTELAQNEQYERTARLITICWDASIFASGSGKARLLNRRGPWSWSQTSLLMCWRARTRIIAKVSGWRRLWISIGRLPLIQRLKTS